MVWVRTNNGKDKSRSFDYGGKSAAFAQDDTFSGKQGKNRQRQRQRQGKSKIRGFFAALRMTKCGGQRRRIGNDKNKSRSSASGER
jgi:hypothetical protein